MDIDHLKKLVDATLEEGEATNDSGPEHDKLVVYLIECVASQLQHMTPEQRVTTIEVIADGWCRHCGSREPPHCHCQNDE